MAKKQNIEDRYREHSGAERAERGYKKPKSSVKSFDRFKEKESRKEERAESPKEKKIEKVMKEFKNKKLRSGSKRGPKVTNAKQAIAIALSESRRKTK